jgi:phage terminase large subunit
LSKLQINTAEVFEPLLHPARYKGAYGGRGSGKSHFFGEGVVEESLYFRGLRTVCVREVQRTLKQSSKKLIEDKIKAFGLGAEFKVFADCIQTPGDGLIMFQGMQDHTAESIKSLEDVDRAVIEEGQTLSERSLMLLRPTIRAPGSEIWAAWNPRRKSDALDKFLRQIKPANAMIVRANWCDNPWFTAELEAERQEDLRSYPERYDHVWEGGYARAFEGAYFAKQMNAASLEKRICRVTADPLLRRRAYWDIGGSGATADALAIWVVQFVGRDILVLDYIEGVGQVLAYYVAELRKRGHGEALCILPHDGVNSNNITGKRYKDHLKDAEFDVKVVPNQGKGAAMMRIESARRIFGRCYFNEETTEAGREALSFYHEKKDEARNVGLGPDHDWSSHGADAFGLMAIDYEPQRMKREAPKERVYEQMSAEPSQEWMAG